MDGTPGRALAQIVQRCNQPRLAALTEFGARVSVTDVVAPARGTRELGAYFAELARGGVPAGVPSPARA